MVIPPVKRGQVYRHMHTGVLVWIDTVSSNVLWKVVDDKKQIEHCKYGTMTVKNFQKEFEFIASTELGGIKMHAAGGDHDGDRT